MADAIIQQGRFTSTGVATTIKLRSDVDWLKVYNVTVAAASQTTAVGVEYYWQRGFPAGAMWEYKKSNAAAAANLSSYATSGGFTLVDSSLQTPGNPVLLTGTSNANPFVVTVDASTGDLVNGDVVRLQNVAGQQNVNGFDFAIANLISNTSFTPAMNFANAPGGAGTGGYWRKIPYNPIYYPSSRTIVNITAATSAVVTVSVAHTYTVGQKVTFRVRAPFGMVEMDGLVGTITAVSTYTFTVDIDSSAFTAFSWADFANAATFPAVLPVGENTSKALSSNLNPFADATINQSYIGIELAAGANSPAGQNNDVIYWVAGVSFLVDNDASLIVT